MDIIKSGEDLILKGVTDFDLKHIFECGQCFRWRKLEEHRYIGVAKGKLLDISQNEDEVLFRKTSEETFREIWFDYFDFKRDYNALKRTMENLHPIVEEAIHFGQGIRVLNQDHWETLISFIVSANNNIPRIKQIIEKLAINYGECVGMFDGEKQYSFPSPKQMKNATVEDFNKVGLGYRSKYIFDVVQTMIAEDKNLNDLESMDTRALEKELLKFSGVGPKVASCIMLFSYGKEDVFPVDTWIKKVMSEWFGIDASDKNTLMEYIEANFGGLEGLVQQYLFYYARENKLGNE